jgi:class 3 adenylate cyclase/CheY-like chemotaxis protein
MVQPPTNGSERTGAIAADEVTQTGRILVVDDLPQNIRLLEAILLPRGYTVLTATSGQQALDLVAEQAPDLVLLDVMMPGLDGHQVCRRLRADPATALLPIIMVTASGEENKVRALDSGADDFIAKPVNHVELLARVRSLLRIKAFHDTIQRQAAALSEWNQLLELRVQEQFNRLQRADRLKLFLPTELAERIVATGDESLLESHRCYLAILFCDLRGFTSFSETADPEEVMSILGEYHAAVGSLIAEYGGVVEHFAGDGLMVFLNDPVPCPDPELQATRLGLAMRDEMVDVCARWRTRGCEVGFGVGVSAGYATLGCIGFDQRLHYGAFGSAVNLAARLCGEARDGQVLVNVRIRAMVGERGEFEPLPDLTLKGFSRPVRAFIAGRVDDPAAS